MPHSIDILRCTQCVQGNCTYMASPPGLDRGEPPVRLKPGQCHLMVPGRFLQWGGNTPNVWLHNVHIRLKTRTEDSNVHLIDWRPAGVDSRLWVTSSTFEGDARPPKPGGRTVAEPASAVWAIRAHTSPIYARGTCPMARMRTPRGAHCAAAFYVCYSTRAHVTAPAGRCCRPTANAICSTRARAAGYDPCVAHRIVNTRAEQACGVPSRLHVHEAGRQSDRVAARGHAARLPVCGQRCHGRCIESRRGGLLRSRARLGAHARVRPCARHQDGPHGV